MNEQSIADWIAAGETELSPDNTLTHLRFRSFVSSSKGRNRKPRQRLQEVELVCDTSDKKFAWVSYHLFQFDVKATEAYPYSSLDGLALEQKLMQDIRGCAR